MPYDFAPLPDFMDIIRSQSASAVSGLGRPDFGRIGPGSLPDRCAPAPLSRSLLVPVLRRILPHRQRPVFDCGFIRARRRWRHVDSPRRSAMGAYPLWQHHRASWFLVVARTWSALWVGLGDRARESRCRCSFYLFACCHSCHRASVLSLKPIMKPWSIKPPNSLWGYAWAD